jgi:hypothetical protein
MYFDKCQYDNKNYVKKQKEFKERILKPARVKQLFTCKTNSFWGLRK